MSKVVSNAMAWVGKSFRPGVKEQCAEFVRHVLAEAGHPYHNRVTQDPVDGHSTSRAFANSLAGRDLGRLVSKISELEPGAILFWANTYGEWPAGTITHVGIYVGDGKFVHRPTLDQPVQLERLSDRSWTRLFRCALLLPAQAPAPEAKPAKLKLFFNPKGGLKLVTTADIHLKAGQQVPIEFLEAELTPG